MIRHLRQAAYRRVPWRNGRGETAEIAVWPEDASAETFEWRVAMAPVQAPGPFSHFDGVDRNLTVIEGSGLTLAVDGAPPVRLGETPFAFPGDVGCVAALSEGAIIDLNVMTRRGLWRADVRHAETWGPDEAAEHRLLFAAHGPVTVEADGAVLDLEDRDTLWIGGPRAHAVQPSGRWLDIRLRRVGSPS